jgi:diguanylate cyclase (GGDEF)-like protein
MGQDSTQSKTWLCPTEFDRVRLLDMEARLQSARAVMFGALGVGAGISVPWIGWAPVALVLTQVLVYALIKPVIKRSSRPEYPIAFVVVQAQVLIAVAVALTGASQSPMLLVFLLGIVGLPARFGTTRVVVAGLVLTEILVIGATAGVDPSGFTADPALTIVTAAACFGLLAFTHALMQAESQKRSESFIDVLTGLPNRRSLELRFEDLRADAVQTGKPLALLVCDLDLFKEINDQFGHPRGDAVLLEVAETIHRSLRPTEQVYRIGGEEFLILVPDCDLDRAAPVAERVREAIESSHPSGLPITVSLGFSAAVGEEIDFNGLFGAADAALYEAKRGGRNRVVPLSLVGSDLSESPRSFSATSG